MGFTNLSDTQISGLTRAGATGAQRAAYTALTRTHRLKQYPGNESWCYRPVDEIARITGNHRDTCAKALRALCEREFMPGVTVLERVGGGHRGQATVYADNLWAYSELMGQEPMPPIGGLQSPTKEGAERWAKMPRKVGEESGKVGEDAPKGGPQSPTQNRNPEEIQRIETHNGTERKESLVELSADDTREAFEGWLWSDTGASSRRPGQVGAWFKRLTKDKRAGLEATFSELDRIAEKQPESDADLSAEELHAVEAARHAFANGYMSEFYAWLALTWYGYRAAPWALN